jgi:hypothetical protein
MTKSSQSIEVEISGGIGNQLFQFAAALTLAQHLNAEIILDVSWYERKRQSVDKRHIELDKFLDLSKIRRVKSKSHPKIQSVIEMAKNYKVINDAKTDLDTFHSLSTRRHIRMRGYWQSEAYFTPVVHFLRSSYSKHLLMSTLANEIANEIRSSVSLGIHVRRGDYITNRKTNSFHGVCGEEYFTNATGMILRSTKIDKIYIFSDDIQWCRENLDFDVPSVLVESRVSDTEQLKLLSLCNHHVISNSSFSWWAAWFGYSEEQVVIYPRAWFSDGSSLKYMPARWISL